MSYDEIVEDAPTEIVVYGNNLPAQQMNSIAPTREGSMMHASIMTGSDLAIRKPRQEALALKKCLDAANSSWLWRVPNRGEGLSVKCARSIVQRYGNVGVFPSVMDTMIPTERGMVPGWVMTVVVVDVENNVMETSTASTLKPERQMKNGKPEADLAYTQRCFQQQLAFLGRVERNAIMKIVPGEWHQQIKDKIIEREQGKPLRERIPTIVKALESVGVSQSDVAKVLGCKPMEMNEAQYQDMLGRGMAIKNGEASREEAFPELYEGKADATEKACDMRKLKEDLKALGLTEADGKDKAAELFKVNRLEALTQGQADQVVAECRKIVEAK